MRNATLLFVLVVSGFAASAQFTFIPQAGIENPVTKISINNRPSFDPLQELQPQLSLRAEYKFKKGFGPFIGINTSRSMINYNFSDPEAATTVYRATAGKMQLQLDAGIQWTSKPISLSRQQATTSRQQSNNKSNNAKTHCGMSKESHHCCMSSCRSKSSFAKTAKPQSWSLRIQPSFGVAYIPAEKPDVVIKTSGSQTSYTYNAGQLETALTGGLGFEFAKGKTKFVTLRFNYFQGLDNNKTSFNSTSGTKSVTTDLSSKVSGWNASIGFPISFTKTHHSTHRNHPECREQYRMHCGQKSIYKF